MDSKKFLRALALALCAIFVLKLVLDPRQASFTTMRVMTVILATGFGSILGWILSPQAHGVRRAIFIGFLTLLAFLTILGGNALGTSAAGLLSIIGFCMAFGYWMASWLRESWQGLTERPTTFGSAEWATLPYLEEHGLIGEEGIRLGVFPSEDGPKPLHYTGDRHLLTIAPTRKGKGVSAIIPNLLTLTSSCLVIDPKGENAMITAQARRDLGQTVHIVDPWGITGETSARFNPLDWLVPGDPDITENAMLLADALVVAEGKSDKFWDEESKAHLQGLILYVATDPREMEQRHLARVRDLLLLDGEDMPALFQRMASSEHHLVASAGSRSLQKEDRLLANVVAATQAQTHFLDSGRLRENLSASDFKFEDLKANTAGTTIYLVLPADRLKPFSRWLRLLIQQALTVSARDIGHQPDKPVLFLLDEMPSLGRLTMVEEAYGLLAGFGLQIWGIVQNAGQLRRIYGEGWEGMIANSGAISYYGSRDRMTAQYFSELCGVTTVFSLSTAISRVFGSSRGQGGVTSSESTTQSDTSTATQRKLAYPDELMRVFPTKTITFIDHHHPIIAHRVRWFDDPALRALGRNLREAPMLLDHIAE